MQNDLPAMTVGWGLVTASASPVFVWAVLLAFWFRAEASYCHWCRSSGSFVDGRPALPRARSWCSWQWWCILPMMSSCGSPWGKWRAPLGPSSQLSSGRHRGLQRNTRCTTENGIVVPWFKTLILYKNIICMHVYTQRLQGKIGSRSLFIYVYRWQSYYGKRTCLHTGINTRKYKIGLQQVTHVYARGSKRSHTGGKCVTCSEFTNSREGQLLR